MNGNRWYWLGSAHRWLTLATMPFPPAAAMAHFDEALKEIFK
jgi:hypothetical protein